MKRMATTLILGEQQIFVALGNTPLGKPHPVPEPCLSGWVKQLTQDWKLDPDDLPDIFDQLNRGQSAEVTNAEGIPLRLWVNPKEKGRGVEALVKQPIQPGRQRDYRKIAAVNLEQQLGDGLDPAEMEELACSVVRQWQKYGGAASLFVGKEQFIFTFTDLGEGNCRVDTEVFTVSIESLLRPFGFPPDVFPEVIARINLGQEIEIRDRQGTVSLLWFDPRVRRVQVRPLNSRSSTPPVFCPKCGAVLKVWQEGEREQACPMCGQTVACTHEAG